MLSNLVHKVFAIHTILSLVRLSFASSKAEYHKKKYFVQSNSLLKHVKTSSKAENKKLSRGKVLRLIRKTREVEHKMLSRLRQLGRLYLISQICGIAYSTMRSQETFKKPLPAELVCISFHLVQILDVVHISSPMLEAPWKGLKNSQL